MSVAGAVGDDMGYLIRRQDGTTGGLGETPRCVAPTGAKGRLCGADATEEQTVEGVVVRLCAEHAREIDEEDAS